jgi:hypothetical protein
LLFADHPSKAPDYVPSRLPKAEVTLLLEALEQ